MSDPMARAFALARAAIATPDGTAFAAVVVQGGVVIAEGINRCSQDHDPTAHAEIVALREAGKRLGSPVLGGCDLYTTCEPCPMCASAIGWAKIDRVFYAARMQDIFPAGADAATPGFAQVDGAAGKALFERWFAQPGFAAQRRALTQRDDRHSAPTPDSPENPMNAVFDASPVPVIDISGFASGDPETRRAIAARVDDACRSVGFLIVSGHGVDPALIAKTDEVTRRFFDLPLEAKRESRSPSPEVYRGYFEMGGSALAYTIGDAESRPDYREGFVMNRHRIDPADPYYTSPIGRSIFRPNIYPPQLPEMREILEAYYDAMTGLATTLMRIFAVALGLDAHAFDDKIDKHMTNLSLSNYPDQDVEPLPGQLRAGAHTDYGSLTILRTEDKPGGLEVLTADKRWVPVPIVPDSFIINIGDLMAQWTNDRWVSTVHRVVNPPRDKTSGTRRQSLIFFHQPNYDAEIRCLDTCAGEGARHAPITSGEHLMNKIRQMTVAKP